MSKIILQGYILVPDADLPAVEAGLSNHISLTKQEAGCLVFDVTQDSDNKNRFNVYEEFADRSAFELHQKRVQDSDWGKIATNAERHYRVFDE